jgi:HlyD family secretion protein
MNRKIAIIASTLLVLASCSGKDSKFDASGTFEATEVVVSSEANGKIISLNLNEGGYVQQNVVYGLVDTIQLCLQKDQLNAGINAAMSKRQDMNMQTGYLREQIATQKKERERIKNLIAAMAGNTKQLDDINSSIAILKKQLDAMESNITQNNNAVEAEVASLKTQVAQVDEQLKRCKISSPINGTVLAKYAEQGELTAIGKPIFKVADIENMRLRAYITAGQLTAIKLGQKVRIFADSGDKGRVEYEGEVTWISDQSEFTPKTIQTRDERANLVYAIKISFKNDGFVKIGMYGDIIF